MQIDKADSGSLLSSLGGEATVSFLICVVWFYFYQIKCQTPQALEYCL